MKPMIIMLIVKAYGSTLRRIGKGLISAAEIYAQRKIDVEPILGKMKASLRFHRLSVRGLDRVRKEAGIVIMALNIRKLVTLVTNSKSKRIGRKTKDRFLVLFHIKRLVMSQPLFMVNYKFNPNKPGNFQWPSGDDGFLIVVD